MIVYTIWCWCSYWYCYLRKSLLNGKELDLYPKCSCLSTFIHSVQGLRKYQILTRVPSFSYLQATASAADTFEWKHWCFAFMIYGSVFLWIWVSICFHVLILVPICGNCGSIWLRFGNHSGSRLISKRFGDQNGAWKLPGFERVYLRGLAALEKQSRKSCFLDFVINSETILAHVSRCVFYSIFFGFLDPWKVTNHVKIK